MTVEDKPATREHVDMPLAFAKYHMVSTDIQRYLGFITANDYPALEDLEATISYQGFFPSSYDVHKNEPNSASRTISYTVPFTNITDSTVTIGGTIYLLMISIRLLMQQLQYRKRLHQPEPQI